MRVGTGVTVRVGRGVLEGIGVAVGHGVLVDVGVPVEVVVGVKVSVGTGVGGSPSTRKRPDTTKNWPTNIWTSYSPTSHSSGSGFQSVKPNPPDPPSQGSVS